MRIVDHEERRRTIAEVALGLIAREGLEATTLNRIAREMRASIRVITHYFPEKDTLLLWVYRAMAVRGQASIQEVVARDPADLAGVLIAMCGGDDEMLKQWRVYVAFWDKAARSPAFADEQHLWSERAVATVSDVLIARFGTLADARRLAMELLSLVYGLSIQRMLAPESWTGAAIASIIERRVLAIEPER